MSVIDVVCPSCGGWRLEDVSAEEIDAALCADSLPIARECRACFCARLEREDLRR